MTDDTPILPEPLEQTLERTLRATTLHGDERRRVEGELRAYFEDALASGVSVSEIMGEFGDPELGGALIKRSPPRRRSPAQTSVLRAAQIATAFTAVLLVSIYGATAVRFRSFAREPADISPWLDTIANVAARAPTWRASLSAAGPAANSRARIHQIGVAVGAVRQTASLGDPFSMLISARVARDIVDAADAVLRDSALTLGDRKDLAARLNALASTTAHRVEAREILEWFDHLVERSFDADGRLTATGLRVAQAMKGARQPSLTARALEPIFFARADDARSARASARRLVASNEIQVHRGALWSTMVVEHINTGLDAQATVAQRLPELIARVRR